MEQHDNKNTCMACSCPCDPFNLVQGRPEQGRMGEMHKEHNHPVEEMSKPENHDDVKSCSTCGVEHKKNNVPACGCN